MTFRYQVKLGDTKQQLAQRFYSDPTLSEIFEIPNGAAQRDLNVGEWLLIPDLAKAGHHTVVAGETLRGAGRTLVRRPVPVDDHLDRQPSRRRRPGTGHVCSSHG